MLSRIVFSISDQLANICGYVLGPFDRSCPKCAQSQAAGGPIPMPQQGYPTQQPYGQPSYRPVPGQQYAKSPVPVIQYMLQFGYEILFVAFVGATLGKMALGIKIVRMDGSDVGFARAIGHTVIKQMLSVFILPHLFIAFHPEKRGLHDLVMGMQVIKN